MTPAQDPPIAAVQLTENVSSVKSVFLFLFYFAKNIIVMIRRKRKKKREKQVVGLISTKKYIRVMGNW